MGSGFSQEANTQHSEISETRENNHNNNNTKTKLATTITTRPNSLPHDCEAILKDADTVIDKSSLDQLYVGVFLNKNRKVGQLLISYPFTYVLLL